MAIDYGRYPMANGQLPNRNPETTIRYGIISQHDLADWVIDEAEPVYFYACECGQEFGNDYPEHESCPNCGQEFTELGGGCGYWDEIEACGWEISADGVTAELDDSGHLWVFQSPVITTGAHCSPCAPGAVSIGTDGDVQCYGLPEDWLR